MRSCIRSVGLGWLALGLVGIVGSACAKEAEVIDVKVAQQDPDFAIQGEYLGEGVAPDGNKVKLGARVIARGDGNFEVYFLIGGLPGEGWKLGDPRVRADGRRDGDAIVVKGEDVEGKITAGKITASSSKGTAELSRVERKSPTLDAAPPAGATVLFAKPEDAKNFNPEGHSGPEGELLSGVTTKEKFGDYQLHLEFRLSWMPKAGGQGRSNSGVYVHDTYEIQVLDSFGLEGLDNECGGLYSIRRPEVNACLPPMVWQTYDIDFTAPKYEGDKKVANARLTLKHNGITIHDDLELVKGTPGRLPEGPAPRAIHLQGHGNKVLYRNIWLVPK